MWLLCGIQTTQKLFATFRHLIQTTNAIAWWFTGIVSGLAHPSSLSSVSRVSPGMAGVNSPTGHFLEKLPVWSAGGSLCQQTYLCMCLSDSNCVKHPWQQLSHWDAAQGPHMYILSIVLKSHLCRHAYRNNEYTYIYIYIATVLYYVCVRVCVT